MKENPDRKKKKKIKKEKIVRGNNAPFMTKELRKATMNTPKLKKKHENWPSRENFENWAKNRKINVINFVENQKRTFLRISQKAI